MDTPIFNPSVPYVGPIEARFTPGNIIKIQGTVSSIANRFNINLQCGPKTSPQDDIALQVSIRLLDGYIALNSLQHGVWDEEQRSIRLPVKCGERFKISLICEFNQYKVDINKQHYYEFPQRILYDCITHLAIDGDVSIIQISCEPVTYSNAAASTAQTNNFKLSNFITATISSGIIHSSASSGFTHQPPSYEAAISAGPPYPKSDFDGRMPQPEMTNLNPLPSASGIQSLPPPPGIIIPFNGKQSSGGPLEETIPLNILSSDGIPLSSSDTHINAPNTHSHSLKAYEILSLILLSVMITAIVTIIIYAHARN
ncbi:hypothetical protein ILUMI_07761 [Ignelater luminosus]|uniref:Galectin n=1 Tax=Ignelater luminosus TaxID=2038154 RepID=A0A8K0D5T2_IGNLU|nr:hypothetical protein ILUMI_07761 [Ignelater luminosus]